MEVVANGRATPPIRKTLKDLILDSSLIVDTNGKIVYDVKLVQCGNYVQVYYLENKKIKTDSTDKNAELNLKKISYSKCKEEKQDLTIDLKNITRSKLACQRLAKCNSLEWKTFITLTFEENIENIKEANKRFRHFINKIHRVEKNFKYLGIIEFQKRGAVHYHVLTNIDINDKRFIYAQEDNKKYKHIKYWIDGFTKVDNIQGDIKKIVGYISKYMTKILIIDYLIVIDTFIPEI